MKQGEWYEDGKRRGGVTLVLSVRPFRMHVTNQHIDYPGWWVGSCSGLFENIRLSMPGKTENAQDAQEELMNIAIGMLNKAVSDLSDIRPLKVKQ